MIAVITALEQLAKAIYLVELVVRTFLLLGHSDSDSGNGDLDPL